MTNFWDSAYTQKFVGLFDFKIASNVAEAERQLLEFKPDVILLDLYMRENITVLIFWKV